MVRFDFNDLNEARKFYKGKPKGHGIQKQFFMIEMFNNWSGSQFQKHEKAVELFIDKLKTVLALNTKPYLNPT